MSDAFGNPEEAENLAQIVITCACLVGFALMGYGTLLFYRRRKALVNEDGAVNLIVSWYPREIAGILNK
ncbi:hypothetical protein BCR32DRAFT_288592 [Anaeromyces robustus]|uniref:Uncharacterized protein n=1 Tax=Anaeromyces robustus TaxID=1754192 RepID=A0A1Y1UG29_9FUNG|nr:hypothetical protein BCR32DRAFT_288592 [Anaeromyces robustus]|eukprot:ORX36978.1 hypothetical protein BCR32DRAFT_288592 [Anaeromyces robustus]